MAKAIDETKPRIWEITVRGLTIYEAGNGFYIRHNRTDSTHGMSDGVDMVEGEEIGSDRWWKAVKRDLRSSYSEYLEAYFPEVAE